MNIQKIPFPVPSSDGIHTLSGWVYTPADTPVGVLHVVHGMTEYIGRYHRFMEELATAGFIVCGYDHLGHGHTVHDPAELGYIAEKRGSEYLVRDVKVFSDAVRARYGQSLPYVLMGHSMGSFVVRLATERCVTPDALIIMGTGGPNPASGMGIAVTGLIQCIRGGKHISPFVERLAFGSYNKRFGGKHADPGAWLTKDAAVRDAYKADPLCNYSFTVSAMSDLIRLTRDANRRAWFSALPDGLPILLVSGTDDPVGNYARGVLTVRDRLAKAGKRVTCHLYDGYRHEILNDASHDRVVQDILGFLQSHVPAARMNPCVYEKRD